MRSLGWALIKIDWYPYKKRKMHAKTETQGECCTVAEAEIGVMQLQAKECQRWTAITSSQGRDKEGFSPRAFRGVQPS